MTFNVCNMHSLTVVLMNSYVLCIKTHLRALFYKVLLQFLSLTTNITQTQLLAL